MAHRVRHFQSSASRVSRATEIHKHETQSNSVAPFLFLSRTTSLQGTGDPTALEHKATECHTATRVANPGCKSKSADFWKVHGVRCLTSPDAPFQRASPEMKLLTYGSGRECDLRMERFRIPFSPTWQSFPEMK